MSLLDAADRQRLRQLRAEAKLIEAPKREANRKARKAQRDASKAARKAAPMKGQRTPRVRDNAYLAFLRRCSCVAGLVEGGCSGPVQACHLRLSVGGKRNPGMQAKADDRWSWPGCNHHHLHDQHRGSEAAFFERLAVDPIELCRALYRAFETGQDGDAALRHFLSEGRHD